MCNAHSAIRVQRTVLAMHSIEPPDTVTNVDDFIHLSILIERFSDRRTTNASVLARVGIARVYVGINQINSAQT